MPRLNIMLKKPPKEKEKKNSSKKSEENAQKKERFDSETTMLVTMVTQEGHVCNACLPTSDVSLVYDEEQDNCIFVIHKAVGTNSPHIKEGANLSSVSVDVTNDPTNARASSVVSLGYYALRLHAENVKIKSMAPFMCEGKASSYHQPKFVRPLRRIPAVLPSYL